MALEIPHPVVDDGKQTLNLERLGPWAKAADETAAALVTDVGALDTRVTDAENDIAAMPGSFAADSIDPSQVDTDVLSALDFTAYTFNSTTHVSISPTVLVPTAGIYTVTATIQIAHTAAVAGDIYTFEMLVDLGNTGTTYKTSVVPFMIDQVVLSYTGAISSGLICRANRFSGTGTGRTNQCVIRGARIG